MPTNPTFHYSNIPTLLLPFTIHHSTCRDVALAQRERNRTIHPSKHPLIQLWFIHPTCLASYLLRLAFNYFLLLVSSFLFFYLLPSILNMYPKAARFLLAFVNHNKEEPKRLFYWLFLRITTPEISPSSFLRTKKCLHLRNRLSFSLPFSSHQCFQYFLSVLRKKFPHPKMTLCRLP